jgi:transketolase N-terminal domain/subunit
MQKMARQGKMARHQGKDGKAKMARDARTQGIGMPSASAGQGIIIGIGMPSRHHHRQQQDGRTQHSGAV